MIKEELYHKSVQILFDAYFNDTLQHNNCYACAVGNLVAANCGYSYQKAKTDKPYHSLFWSAKKQNVYTRGDLPVSKDKDLWYNAISGGEVFVGYLTEKMIEEITATGYSAQQLALIEDAFESVEFTGNEDVYMFEGLAKVLEVLRDIHQVTDEDLIQGNNKRFKDHYNKRTEKSFAV